jgi:lysophospholipase L1-like esterase
MRYSHAACAWLLGLGLLACGQSDGVTPDSGPEQSGPGKEGGAAFEGSVEDAGGNQGADGVGMNADARGGTADGAIPDGAVPDSAMPDGARDTGGVRDTGGADAGDAGPSGLSEGGADGGSGAPGVRIVGRTVQGTMGPRFEWPGVSIEARFSGTQVSIQLNDSGNLNEFEVVVDGTTTSNFVTSSGLTTYPLATGLANATHDVLVWRRTESYYNFTEFLGMTGFSSGGALLAPPPAPARRIEVIGDSISCGYGVEGSSSCTNGQLESIENNYLAYGSVAARDLSADVVTIAWSGIGLYRNYNEVGPSTNTMPQRYDFAIPTDTSTTWDFSLYQPQAIVINLTSNDFSTMGDPGKPYIDAFVNFIAHIRSKYPTAYIFCVVEWATSGPDVDSVVSTVKAGGDTNIESFDIRSFANGNGCQGHPDVAGSKAMGDALAAEIKRVLSW